MPSKSPPTSATTSPHLAPVRTSTAPIASLSRHTTNAQPIAQSAIVFPPSRGHVWGDETFTAAGKKSRFGNFGGATSGDEDGDAIGGSSRNVFSGADRLDRDNGSGSRSGSRKGGSWATTEEQAELVRTKVKLLEDELQTSVSSLATGSSETSRRLDYALISLRSHIHDLSTTLSSLSTLSSTTSTLLGNYYTATRTLTHSTSSQIAELSGTPLSKAESRIRELEDRMGRGRDTVEELGRRLEGARDRVEKWGEREREWQARTSRRLRALWGVLVSLVIVVVLAVIWKRTGLGEILWNTAETPKTGKTNISEHSDLPAEVAELLKDVMTVSKSEHTSAFPNSASPSVPTETTSGFSRARDADDFLRIFDEL
ncbi:MAG: hypothetical protein M1834_004969 [Cirrosporium novae-zelandiae]|nr:MAG: hypothetical protein M1834_004969 [Cirrosporium novae-zelandiae]